MRGSQRGTRVVPIVLALSWVACGGAAPSSQTVELERPTLAAAALTLFPERPALDAIAPSRANFFKQETWTEIAGGGAQHCHEWAFDAADEASVRDEANAALGSLGIVARFGGTIREDGIAGSFGPVGSDVLRGVDRALVKLTVCTEGSAAIERHRAFVAPIEARAIALMGDTRELGALAADVAWERRYADGRRQIGVRWRDLEVSFARAWMMGHGYRESTAPSGAIDVVRGPERVRFLGDVWWQSEVLAE